MDEQLTEGKLIGIETGFHPHKSRVTEKVTPRMQPTAENMHMFEFLEEKDEKSMYKLDQTCFLASALQMSRSSHLFIAQPVLWPVQSTYLKVVMQTVSGRPQLPQGCSWPLPAWGTSNCIIWCPERGTAASCCECIEHSGLTD